MCVLVADKTTEVHLGSFVFAEEICLNILLTESRISP